MNGRLRTLLAAALSLAGAGCFYASLPGSHSTGALIPPVALVVAAGVALAPSLGAQLLARGLWWSNFLLGVLLVLVGSGRESKTGALLGLFCSGALLVADRTRLTAAADAAGFRPAAYAGTLQLLLVLALADAQTLLLFGAVELQHTGATAAVFFGLALGFVVGFVALLRLSLAGVVVTMGSALALALVVGTQAVRVDPDLRLPLLVVACVQLAVPLPMLVSMATRRPLPALPLRTRAHVARAVIVLIVLATAAARLLFGRLR